MLDLVSLSRMRHEPIDPQKIQAKTTSFEKMVLSFESLTTV